MLTALAAQEPFRLSGEQIDGSFQFKGRIRQHLVRLRKKDRQAIFRHPRGDIAFIQLFSVKKRPSDRT